MPRAPKGRQTCGSAAPSGLGCIDRRLPGACAPGYSRTPLRGWRTPRSRPVIDVLDVADLVLHDVLLAALDLLAHQLAEQVLGRLRVVERHPQQRPLGRVERGLPQLVRVHLA